MGRVIPSSSRLAIPHPYFVRTVHTSAVLFFPQDLKAYHEVRVIHMSEVHIQGHYLFSVSGYFFFGLQIEADAHMKNTKVAFNSFSFSYKLIWMHLMIFRKIQTFLAVIQTRSGTWGGMNSLPFH